MNIGFDLNTKKREEIKELTEQNVDYKKKETDMKDILKKLEKKKEISDEVIAKNENQGLEKRIKVINDELEEKQSNTNERNIVTKHEEEIQELLVKINQIQEENSEEKRQT